eukprot:GFUD01009092.1.p1 GENE.GFUD01009092.1~~GFUD01009092.1.p1  ORF type:complete len:613 (-),score=220.70 GFUD01009092.1:9-1847(-)
MPTLMKCHYEVLEAARDADADTLKKQYRKMALKFHPDKNPDDPEGAKQTFQVIQQAYDVLSDSQERAWYDNHREQILQGGLGEKLEDEGIDLFQYFSTSCYSGFGDDDSGFYGVYSEVFNTLAKEDLDFIDDEDSDFEIPGFGKSRDEYESVVGPFYAYWTSYNTPRSFSWLDKYDTRQGENRWMKRKMEAENKKLRDKARKERNEAVRNLVQFVRKRDKRLVEYSKKLQEKAELNKKKTLEFHKKQREERKKLFAGGSGGTGGGDGFGMSEMEAQLRQLEGEYTDSEEESDNDLGSDEEEEMGEELDDLYCVACDKIFKTVGAKDNHGTSRKHKENLEKLIEEMNEEEEIAEEVAEEAAEEAESGENSEKTDLLVEVNEVVISEEGEQDESADTNFANISETKSKKMKKKQKKKVPKLVPVSDSDPEPDNTFHRTGNGSSDEGSNRKKKGKGKNKKKSKKEKSPEEPSSETPVTIPSQTENVNLTELEEEYLDNLAKGETLKIEKEATETEKYLLPEDEVTIIKATFSEHDLNEDSSYKSCSKAKKTKSKDPSENAESVPKVNLTCAQCTTIFPSKNKLYNHLKTSGHAVFLSPTDPKPGLASKSKKKNRK